MDSKSVRVSSILIALILLFCAPFSIAQEVDDEREFSYDVNSPNGPDHWGEIHPEWSLCNKGNMQSPIDITRNRVQTTSSLGRLERHYKPANSTLMNRGHDIMLKWVGGAGYIHISGTKYQLNQVHWHTPTEHAINGRRFILELHMVHQSANGKVAVIGILYKIGRPDTFLSILETYIKALSYTRDVEKSVGIIDPRQIKFESRNYYRYIGSLTTPPCTENVIWTIIKEVRTVSRAQVYGIREAIHDDAQTNARPIQPLNNRVVQLYKPDNHHTY